MKIICTRCGSTDVLCGARVNPNTKEFSHFCDEAFMGGWCKQCGRDAVLTDAGEIQKEMEYRFQKFVEECGHEPDYANCHIVWKDADDHYDVRIQLSADSNPEVDDDMFFYCNSLEGLKSLTEPGNEDFVITECHGFGSLTEEELVRKRVFSYEIGGRNISVTGSEVFRFYPREYGLSAEDVERYAARYVARIKLYSTCERWLDPKLVQQLLGGKCLMDKGDTEGFKLKLAFAWYVEICREDEPCLAPFVYTLNGYCLENNQTVSRRYRKLEEALLHCLNHFNENTAIPNPYKSIRDYLSKPPRLSDGYKCDQR